MIKKSIHVICISILWVLPHPGLRAALLRLLGAKVGPGVRVHRGLLLNAEHGFSTLSLGAGVYIGPGVTLDLFGPLRLGERTTVSVGAILLTHSDAGRSHGSGLIALFPPTRHGVDIGADCWIGAGAIILDGGSVGDRSVVGAGAVVTRPLPGGSVYAGNPARPIRTI